MNIIIQRRLALSAVAAGLMVIGVNASAQQFPMTATVQNAVTLTEVTPLNFGTVFATRTVVGAGGNDADSSAKLTLAPTGTFTPTASSSGTGGGQVLSLGGATAGQYSAPGLPGNSIVRVVFSNASDLAVTPAASVALASCLYDTPAAALAANKVVLTNSVGDPTIGFFCVDVFTSNRTGLLGAGYALGFGVTTLTFDLGATLVAQAPSGAVAAGRTFEAGTYTGTLGMEVQFP